MAFGTPGHINWISGRYACKQIPARGYLVCIYGNLNASRMPQFQQRGGQDVRAPALMRSGRARAFVIVWIFPGNSQDIAIQGSTDIGFAAMRCPTRRKLEFLIQEAEAGWTKLVSARLRGTALPRLLAGVYILPLASDYSGSPISPTVITVFKSWKIG